MTHPTRHDGTPAEAALERGWDLFQHDGYWYVHPSLGGDRKPGNEQQLGSGPSPADAMAGAVSEYDRRETERKAAEAARAEPQPLDGAARVGIGVRGTGRVAP